ncbi:MAG: Zn-ribbon domain-containing OB-fold protein [Actinomycetota bacterium]
MSKQRVPAVDGWFTLDDEPHLIGGRCADCGTYVFPPRAGACPNPECESDELVPTTLSRHGRVWSYTENRYAPPPPYKAAEPFEPYALVAVELEKEGIIVLGQAPKGILAPDLKVGMRMQLETDVLFAESNEQGGTTEHMIYVWAPAVESASGSNAGVAS